MMTPENWLKLAREMYAAVAKSKGQPPELPETEQVIWFEAIRSTCRLYDSMREMQ